MRREGAETETVVQGHRTKTESAVRTLRDRIRTGELVAGQRLRIEELKAELGMSPTPIREALRLLQADGLIDYRPHQGMVVSKLSPLDVAEVLRLRLVLEPLAVELAVPQLTAADLDELEELHARYWHAVGAGRGTAVNELNADWHWVLYRASGSSLLQDFIRRLWDAYPWRTAWALPGLPENSLRQHEVMMAAIRARDVRAVAEHLYEHLDGTRAILFEEPHRLEETVDRELEL